MRQDEKHEEVGGVMWHKHSTFMYEVLNIFQKATKYRKISAHLIVLVKDYYRLASRSLYNLALSFMVSMQSTKQITYHLL